MHRRFRRLLGGVEESAHYFLISLLFVNRNPLWISLLILFINLMALFKLVRDEMNKCSYMYGIWVACNLLCACFLGVTLNVIHVVLVSLRHGDPNE